ncbi:MAG: hypothetical protein M1826_002477 [Phylliscum demangeonii]|nr:MAG: hypothetical protein M1826_002477 [Phylliscum demangeonii]
MDKAREPLQTSLWISEDVPERDMNPTNCVTAPDQRHCSVRGIPHDLEGVVASFLFLLNERPAILRPTLCAYTAGQELDERSWNRGPGPLARVAADLAVGDSTAPAVPAWPSEDTMADDAPAADPAAIEPTIIDLTSDDDDDDVGVPTPAPTGRDRQSLPHRPSSAHLLPRPPSPTLLDLTSPAARPPRFPRDIIDVDALPDRALPPPPPGTLHPSSPDLEVTGARRIWPLDRPRPPLPPLPAASRNAWVDYDQLLLHDAQALEQARTSRPGLANLLPPRYSWRATGPVDVDVDVPPSIHLHRTSHLTLGMIRHPDIIETIVPATQIRLGTPPPFAAPGALDYQHRALAGPGRPPEPSPDPARAGYTRTPTEQDMVVCPNCGDELTTGETEGKRQVWFVKACGHVYCGDCAIHRGKSPKKGAARQGSGEPFRNCKVCNRPVYMPKAMRQLYV